MGLNGLCGCWGGWMEMGWIVVMGLVVDGVGGAWFSLLIAVGVWGWLVAMGLRCGGVDFGDVRVVEFCVSGL